MVSANGDLSDKDESVVKMLLLLTVPFWLHNNYVPAY